MVLNGRKGIVGGIDGRYSKTSTYPYLPTPQQSMVLSVEGRDRDAAMERLWSACLEMVEGVRAWSR